MFRCAVCLGPVHVKFFQCPSCRHPVSFEHVACANCSTELAFDSSRIEMTKLASHQSCRNREIIGCNWCVEGADWYCGSCRLTRTIPNLGSTRNIMLWRRMEEAKVRLPDSNAVRDRSALSKRVRMRLGRRASMRNTTRPLVMAIISGRFAWRKPRPSSPSTIWPKSEGWWDVPSWQGLGHEGDGRGSRESRESQAAVQPGG